MPQSTEQIESLVRTIEGLDDPVARECSLALVKALMEFHGAGLDRLMEIVADAGDPGFAIFDKFAQDEVVSSLLLLYGLHPLPLETRVSQALGRVRPYLDSHGGNVELLGIKDGVVHLRMQGSCKSCPSSEVTLKLAIEEAIYAAAPDVTAIEARGTDEQKPKQSGFVQIGKPSTGGGNGNGHVSKKSKGWEEVADLMSLAESAVTLREVSGRSILFCRLGESVYAYGDSCPGCGQVLQDAYLQMTSLVCTHCNQRFDVIRAGRGLDQPNLHLEPLPLLFEQGTARIALPPLSVS